MPPRHDLKTIEEIIDVITPENLENFLIDFRGFLTLNLTIASVQDIFGKENVKIEREERKVFHWIDDGKTEAHIHVKYEDHSHYHCWENSPKPSPCDQPIENHKQCCLCDKLKP